MYQQAISYGFVNRLSQKIELLKALIVPTSALVDDCQFELAQSYTKDNDTAAAIGAYDVLINTAKDSLPFERLLNKGSYNTTKETPQQQT